VDNVLITAVLLGLLSAASLPLGALLGVYWRPGDRPMAFFLAFGGGALIAALAVELVAGAVEEGQVWAMAVGAIAGGLVFKGLNALVNTGGGYLRKPSTAIAYWKHKARKHFRATLSGLKRSKLLAVLPSAQLESLLPAVMVRELPEGTTVYRPGDPAENLYIIESGAVDLLDPEQNNRVLEHMGAKSLFGRLSFITGTPRATETVTTERSRLLILPRRAFLELIEEHPGLWEPLAQRLKDDEVLDFLRRRQGMSAEAVADWSARAVAQVRAEGRFEPPLAPRGLAAPDQGQLADALRDAKRTRFFAELPDAEREVIAERLIVKTAPAGHTFFHIGEPGHRLYLLRRGRVAMLDPDDPSRRPIQIHPGEVFGRYSFFTDGEHTVAAVAAEDCEVLVLRRKDFDALLLERPQLRQALAGYLRGAGVADYLTRKQDIDTDRAAHWLDQAVQRVERGRLVPSLWELKRDVGGHSGAAVAILLGVLLDGVPEALVVGAGATGGAVSIALLGSIFVSNFPEALSSAAGMREQGFRTGRILTMWLGLMVMTGVIAGLGALTMTQAPPAAYAVIEGFAAGAMLTVVAETMLPEAYQRGGGIVGLSTLAGFLLAVLLSGAA
jgi:CRP-like cAMP-binding protein